MHASNRWEHCDNKERSLKALLANWASLIAPSSGGWRLELFPKRKSVARGRVLLTPLLPTSSNEGREIKAQGYTGTARSVYRHLETLKQAEVRTSLNPQRLQKYSANTAIWLFVRDGKKLNEIEREDLATFCQASAALKKAYDLVQDFLSMVHKRAGHRLDAWLVRAAESGLPELQSFVSGVEKDKDAVQAGFTWPINNGMVEGHVTKLKLIKRTMYGRAGFSLLRQRVLHAL